MATRVYKFFKIFRESMPPDSPRAFLILKMLQNNSVVKNYARKYVKFWCVFPEKLSEYAAEHESTFQTAFYVVFGSNVFVLG